MGRWDGCALPPVQIASVRICLVLLCGVRIKIAIDKSRHGETRNASSVSPSSWMRRRPKAGAAAVAPKPPRASIWEASGALMRDGAAGLIQHCLRLGCFAIGQLTFPRL